MEGPFVHPARDRRGRRRGAGRRWCIPPAIIREPNETLEASQILEENPPDLALVLWNSLRDVTLWSSVEPGRRDGLFSPDAAGKRLEQLKTSHVDPALEVSLTSLVAVVDAPVTTNPEIVSLVCLEISRWAQARGLMGTAIAFAQAAALASPVDPRPAYRVGYLALDWHREARAETWLRRGIGLARRARDWQVYAEGYVDLGALYARRRLPLEARRHYTKAVRAARRHGLLPTRGAALHGLFLLAMDAAELDAAERLARLAMRAYGRGHPRTRELLHDIAYLWVVREDYGRAIPLLQKLLATRTEPVERAITLAVLARAAAGTGDRRLYQQAWSDAWSIINRPGAREPDVRTLLELARAAARLKDWIRVDQATRLQAAQRTQPEDPCVVEELAKLVAAGRSRAES